MKRVLTIGVLVFIFSLFEFIVFNLLGPWFTPNLLIILIIFFNLYLGIRYSILTAALAGLIKDSFTVNYFGLNIFSFILCAYLITLIKKYLYQVGSLSHRVVLVFLISILNTMIHFVLLSMFITLDFRQVMLSVLLPEVALTVVVSDYVFKRLKQCMAWVGI